MLYDVPPDPPGYYYRHDNSTPTVSLGYTVAPEPKRVGHRVPESDPLVVNPGMTRSAWHREHRAPSPPVLGVARSQEVRPFVPRAPVERRHRSSLRRFVAGV